jgi:hypothetical protein
MTARIALWPHSKSGSSAMSTRHRFKQESSLQDRLVSFAREARHKASLLPPGAEQDVLLNKARQADAALRLDSWANSVGLQPPK